MFYAPQVKHRRVVFIGRKHSDHARKVALMASQDEELSNLEFRELGQMEHNEVAMAMRDALICLSCGHPEGFGLPLAELLYVAAWSWDITG